MNDDRQMTSGPRPFPRFLRWALGLLVLVAIIVTGGFFFFANHVSSMKLTDDPQTADAIVVLTGGDNRLGAGVDLLRNKKGKRLLISGVNPKTDKEDIRRATDGNSDMFSCCIDLDYAALDTVGNAAESAAWLAEHGYRSVLLVTSNYHMPRSLLEARRAYSGIEVRPYPVISDQISDKWLTDQQNLRILIKEYLKYIASLAGASPRIQASLARSG